MRVNVFFCRNVQRVLCVWRKNSEKERLRRGFFSSLLCSLCAPAIHFPSIPPCLSLYAKCAKPKNSHLLVAYSYQSVIAKKRVRPQAALATHTMHQPNHAEHTFFDVQEPIGNSNSSPTHTIEIELNTEDTVDESLDLCCLMSRR